MRKGTKKLTQRQKDILFFIIQYREKQGYPPTIREIGDEFGISSPNGVKDHLKSLGRKGYIILHPRTARGIELPDKKPAGLPLSPRIAVPMLGEVKGLDLQTFMSEASDSFVIEDYFPKDKGVFAVKVLGDSMTGAGMSDGDFVLAKSSDKAKKGDIVAAVVGDKVTIKAFGGKSSAGVTLLPMNPKHKPIVSKDTRIVGIVIGLLRRY